jgi:hypothetical protein
LRRVIVGLFVVRVQSDCVTCTTRADRDSDGYKVCQYTCAEPHIDPTGYQNMDTIANTYTFVDNDPDITTDEYGRAYIHVNGIAYRYEYADTHTANDSSREKYPDAASIDATTTDDGADAAGR